MEDVIMRDSFSFDDNDKNTICVYSWMPNESPRAIVQISHGMAEYANRYEGFALELNKHGYGVYINDIIGHGNSVKSKDDLGHFPVNGFNVAVNDMYMLTKIINKNYLNVPVIILGHSMGSFLTQEYITLHGNEIDGCILSGTAGKQSASSVGAFIAKYYVKLQGGRRRNKFLDKLSFGNYNKSFKPNRTAFDWLSRDEKEVDKYIESDLCGFICTNGFYYELFSSMSKLNNLTKLKNIPKELPIYIFGGDDDPVGNKTKNVFSLIEMYSALPIKDLEYRFYKGGRHEMLNEINKSDVIDDIITWLNRKF
jgi:alpha-beta hydrolase superfamily lysophospholipase